MKPLVGFLDFYTIDGFLLDLSLRTFLFPNNRDPPDFYADASESSRDLVCLSYPRFLTSEIMMWVSIMVEINKCHFWKLVRLHLVLWEHVLRMSWLL